MKCWKCGTELDDDAIFCMECGAQVEGAQNGDRLKKVVFLLVGILICAGLLVVGVFVLSRGKKDDAGKDVNLTAETVNNMRETVEDTSAATETAETFSDYSWILEPEVEADDIYYPVENRESAEIDGKYHIWTLNELNKQIANPNAVIKKDSALGVITMEGELAADLEYKQIEGYGQDYMMVRIEPVATEEYGDWDLYWLLENGEIIAGLGDGSSAYYLYYYCDGLHHTYEGRESSLEEPETAIPVQQTELMYDLDNLSDRDERMAGKYAVFKKGVAVTEFIYDECGSCSEGLLAVCQNGKWGYINEAGETVIPIEYGASWSQYRDRWDYYGGEKDFCYAASGGYVPLVKDGEWELRNTAGELVIPPGVFEAIRPVYEGKCWVRKDGKWGVIVLGDASDEDAQREGDTDKETERTDAYTKEEISEIIIRHYNHMLEEEYYGTYSISSQEIMETATEYVYPLRFSMSERRRQELLEEGIPETSSVFYANVLMGCVIVDKKTGDVTLEDSMMEEEAWNVYSGEDYEEPREAETVYVPETEKETEPEAIINFAGVINKADQQNMLWEGSLLDASYMNMLLENVKADYAGYVLDLANMEEYSIGDADADMPASALIGIPILFTIADQADKGNISLDSPVTLEYTFENGRGIFKKSDDGKKFPLSQMLSEALKNSDNNALNSLINFLKLKKINRVCHSYGFESVNLERKLISKNTSKENYISPRDAAMMLNAVYQDNFYSIGRDFLEENFRISAADTSNVGMYPAYSSCDTFLNLNGITKSRYNEVGLVEDGGEAFILSIFTCEGDGEKSAVAVQSLAEYVMRTLEKE